MQSAQANHVTTLKRKKFSETELGSPHVEAVIFYNLGFGYSLPKTNYDSYTCQKTKFTS
jgi:hypothetical protein